jgi:hypothetical protein
MLRNPGWPQADQQLSFRHRRRDVDGIMSESADIELIQKIEKDYDAELSRIFAGHSFGGLFASHTSLPLPILLFHHGDHHRNQRHSITYGFPVS